MTNRKSTIVAADANRDLVPQMLRLDEDVDTKLVAKYKDVYDETLENLLHDARVKVGDGRLEQMMCERLALLYVVLRHREAQGIGEVNPAATGSDVVIPGFDTLDEYMTFNKMWFALAKDLQRAQQSAVETNRALAAQKEELFSGFETAVREVISEVGITGKTAKDVQEAFADKVDKLWNGGGSHRTRG